MIAVVVIGGAGQVDVGTQRNLRTQVSIGFVVAVLIVNPIQKWKVVIAMATSAIMSHEWVILVTKISAVHPRMIVVVVDLVFVVVAKIILATVVAEKEVNEKVSTCVNAIVGAVAIRVLKVPIVIKSDWREDCATFFKFIIPVPSPVNASSRCPNIAGGDPDPVFFTRVPVTRSPEILLSICLEFPMTWAVKIVFVGSFG